MKTITLAKPWTYRTPLVTVEYTAGTHEVTDAIAAAAPKEKRNGGGSTKASPARATATPES